MNVNGIFKMTQDDDFIGNERKTCRHGKLVSSCIADVTLNHPATYKLLASKAFQGLIEDVQPGNSTAF